MKIPFRGRVGVQEMSTKRGFGEDDWFSKIQDQISGKDLARQLSSTSTFIDGMNRQQQLMDQITGAQRDALSGAEAASRLISPDYLKQFDALAPLREREQQLRDQINGAHTDAISGATAASRMVSPDYLKQFDALAPYREREQQLMDQISGITGTQAMKLSGAYGAERLTNLAGRAMDHHSSLFTREAERISRMMPDTGHAFREQAELLANSYQEHFHAITGLNEQAIRAVTAQPDWFHGVNEAAGMSVASIARNLMTDITGIFSARTLAYQLTQRSQESMLASLLKGIDPLEHASKELELSTRHLRDLNLAAAQEQVRAFVESPAYEHIRSMTAMIAEAMAGGDEGRARSAWQSAAEDEAFAEVWRQFQTILYNLIQQLTQRRRQKKNQSRKTIRAWLKDNRDILNLITIVLAAASLVATVCEHPLELGWQRLLSPVSAPLATAGQSVQLIYFRVTGDDVRVRLGPSTMQHIVATVNQGNVVQRLGVCKTWSLVALHTGRDDGQPVSGWIKSIYLKQLEIGVDPSTVSKPVVVDGCDE